MNWRLIVFAILLVFLIFIACQPRISPTTVATPETTASHNELDTKKIEQPASAISFPYQSPSCPLKLGGEEVRVSCSHYPNAVIETWERSHLDRLKKSPRKCLVSFGEWLGPIAIFWLHIHSKHTVIAFEPNPLTFSGLYANMKYSDKSRYLLEHKCVNTDGKSSTIESTQYNSMTKINQGSYKVDCISYKSLYEIYQDQDCVFKIDVEGYEENLMDDILKFPPNELSLSLHDSEKIQHNVERASKVGISVLLQIKN